MAKCAGCGRDHTEFPCYQEESVTYDGSYCSATDKFVCDDCFVKLVIIDRELSVGRPEVLQANAAKHLGGKS